MKTVEETIVFFEKKNMPNLANLTQHCHKNNVTKVGSDTIDNSLYTPLGKIKVLMKDAWETDLVTPMSIVHAGAETSFWIGIGNQPAVKCLQVIPVCSKRIGKPKMKVLESVAGTFLGELLQKQAA